MTDKLICASDDTPKLWGDMTDEEKATLLLAEYKGEVIEYRHKAGKYFQIKPCAGMWFDDYVYRVKPEPVRETVAMTGADFGKGQSVAWSFRQNGHIGKETHRITFETVDGKPDCDSIKMEEIVE